MAKPSRTWGIVIHILSTHLVSSLKDFNGVKDTGIGRFPGPKGLNLMVMVEDLLSQFPEVGFSKIAYRTFGRGRVRLVAIGEEDKGNLFDLKLIN